MSCKSRNFGRSELYYNIFVKAKLQDRNLTQVKSTVSTLTEKLKE